jgi:hypothetical protein
MRRIGDGQARDALRRGVRGHPCHHAAPVMADQRKALHAQRIGQSQHIADQLFGA